MTEGKAAATNRLTREGRWGEASAYKDSIIAQCRSEGMRKAEAQEKGWAAMLEKYPPLPAPETQPVEADLQLDGDIDELPSSTSASFASDILWVYANLAKSTVSAESAPSSGAVALLAWARANQDDFFKNLLPKAMAAATKNSQDDDYAEFQEWKANQEHLEMIKELTGYKDPNEGRELTLAEMMYGPGWKPDCPKIHCDDWDSVMEWCSNKSSIGEVGR